MEAKRLAKENPKQSTIFKIQKNRLSQKENFIKEKLIGKGGFGKVWKVRSKCDNKIYAMKEVSKNLVENDKDFESIMKERNIMKQLGDHSFLVSLISSFQDSENFYYVMDFYECGDLSYYIDEDYKFEEEQIKFFAGCIITALEHIHKNNYIHRDIKLGNLLFDKQGYLHLTDFGLSEFYEKENARLNGGTITYMAPEILNRKNHEFSVDFYALGVLLYNINFDDYPYDGENEKSILKKMDIKKNLNKNLYVKNRLNELSKTKDISSEQIEFIKDLLKFNPEKRLGFKGIKEIKRHPWFKGFDWSKLEQREMKSPFKPKILEDPYIESETGDSSNSSSSSEEKEEEEKEEESDDDEESSNEDKSIESIESYDSNDNEYEDLEKEKLFKKFNYVNEKFCFQKNFIKKIYSHKRRRIKRFKKQKYIINNDKLININDSNDYLKFNYIDYIHAKNINTDFINNNEEMIYRYRF